MTSFFFLLFLAPLPYDKKRVGKKGHMKKERAWKKEAKQMTRSRNNNWKQ